MAEQLIQQILLADAARESFADDLKEPIPDAWVAMIDRATFSSSAGRVTSLAARRASRKSTISRWAIGASMAASVVIGLYVTSAPSSQALISVEDGQLIASADLSGALDQARGGLAIPIDPDHRLDVQLSLRKASGSFCREAIVDAPGIEQDRHIFACKDDGDWTISAFANAPRRESGFAAVSSDRPLDALVEAIEGETLDQSAEERAIRMKWQDPATDDRQRVQ
ncbi:hypothetical protein [Sphingosinicella soli]|uniref:Anti-sigma factor n=1 Tax=Sphingosinicella soli TaxID=333708 RepID=A0A7W7B4M7_9SPHN|nr:hypothetical protein [Sphingosinicella soli]MBB4633916.1 hypothetical protein [Sphingosinicella soli]